jgi:NADH:ubiquinone oxidoreductase subunit 6 (subunit J)
MRRKRSVREVVLIAIVLALVAAPTLLASLWHISHGRGADTYTNVYGLAIHWTSPLILVVALVSTLIVALIARMVILRREKRETLKVIRAIVVRAGADE